VTALLSTNELHTTANYMNILSVGCSSPVSVLQQILRKMQKKTDFMHF